jgi:hypothetical protein
MKLSYRNSEYNNELSYLATKESDIKAKYRGIIYYIRQKYQPNNQNKVQLKYRGSLYQKGIQLEKPELEKKYVWQGAIA